MSTTSGPVGGPAPGGTGGTGGGGSAVAPPPPKRSLLWTGFIFVVGTFAGWLTEDLIKKPAVEFVELLAQPYVPWDSRVVQYFMPNTIGFEASKASGCSGGELQRLVTQAEKQGLNFPDEERVSNTRLCQSWAYHGSARSILEHMATKFEKCFSLDQTRSFDTRLNENLVCKTDYALNPTTNEWVKTQGATTLLCLNTPVNTPMSQSEPVAHECPDSVLKDLQFIQ